MRAIILLLTLTLGLQYIHAGDNYIGGNGFITDINTGGNPSTSNGGSVSGGSIGNPSSQTPAPTVQAEAPKKRYKGLGAVINWVGQGFKAIGQAGKWLWNKAIKPAGQAIGDAASWVWNRGISPAANWIWRDAFGVGSQGKKGIAAAGRWIGEDVIGINSRGKKGIAGVGSWIGRQASSAWHWLVDDVDDAVHTFGQ